MTERRPLAAGTDVIDSAPATNGAASARYVTADEFLAVGGKVVTEEVHIPLVNGTIIVRALTAHDVQRAREDATETKGGRQVPRRDRDFATMAFFYAAVGPDGTQFFQRHQIEQLHNINYGMIQPGVRTALRLSGLDEEAEEMARKKAFEGNV